MNESIDLSRTIAPKSDQLNADDLIAGPKTITVTGIKLVAEDQPVAIHFEGDDGKPYKPCKSMRRVLIKAWGPNGAAYVGRSMTLYLDEQVRFGGAAVGGIRISHLTAIDKPLSMALTATRGTKKAYTVQPLEVQQADKSALKAVLDQIAASTGKEGLSKAKEMAGKLTEEDRPTAAEAYKARASELKRAAAQVSKETGEVAAPMTYAQVAEMIEKSKHHYELDIAVDMIRLIPDEHQRDELREAYRRVVATLEASESAAAQA